MLRPSQGDRNAEAPLSRRDFSDRVAYGTSGAALAYLLGKDGYGGHGLLGSEAARASFDLKPRAPQFRPRAKAVIQLVMQGGPSHLDLFDPKPQLEKFRGRAPSREMVA